ncbi:MAG: sensor domain-containing diguanylate cyclase [Immundisolibacteraceae bacterium]|nr:sensor domain-containing diguanylate cyclase [Immundisolibacteraceae bacterium]
MSNLFDSPHVMILAETEVGSRLKEQLSAPNRQVSLFTKSYDLLYQIADLHSALIIVDAHTVDVSPRLLCMRIQALIAEPLPAMLVLADTEASVEFPIETASGSFDCLPSDCGADILKIKVSFLLRLQRQQQLFQSSLQELDRLNRQHHQLLDGTADGILGLDQQGMICFSNSAAGGLLGCESKQLLGVFYEALLTPQWSSQQKIEATVGSDSLAADSKAIELVGEEVEFYRHDGESFPVACRPGEVAGDSEVVSVVLFEDISARKRNEASLKRRAEQDPLTGLANRAAFGDFLAGALARATRSSQQVGLLYLDLDQFKPINDQYGHQVGDEILMGVAKRLMASVRGGDLVARVGGDEFVIVLDDVAGEHGCEAAAQTIETVLNTAYQVGSRLIHCRPSVGIARFPADGQDQQSLVQSADKAMYREKMRQRRESGVRLEQVA